MRKSLRDQKLIPFVFSANSSGTCEGVFFSAQSKLHSKCPDENVDVLFSMEKELSNLFFRTSSQRIPAFVRKLQALLSKFLVVILEKPLGIENFLDRKKYCFWNFSKGKVSDFWSPLLGSSVRTASYPLNFVSIWKLREKINWESHWALNCRDLRGKFLDIWQKNKVLRKKVHEDGENSLLFTEKTVEENRMFLWTENSFNGNIRPEQKIQIFNRIFFQQFCRKTMPSFSEKPLRFFVKKINSFRCSIKQFWDSRWYIFCSAAKASIYVSGRNFRHFFFETRFISIFFLVLWPKNIRLLSGNIKWFWLRCFWQCRGSFSR